MKKLPNLRYLFRKMILECYVHISDPERLMFDVPVMKVVSDIVYKEELTTFH